MAREKRRKEIAQAWIELVTDDPEAVSALAVARARLGVGAGLTGLRRMRVIEISGPLPGREQIENLLHHSTQFYNPHKERCILRTEVAHPAPLSPDERVVLVVDRDGARRGAAERWWRHETGEQVEVKEAVAWLAAFTGEPGAASNELEELAVVRDRERGLLCNPHSQRCRMADGAVPLPWIEETPEVPKRHGRAGGTRGRRTGA